MTDRDAGATSPPIPKAELDARIAAFVERRDRVHSLRGRFISDMNELEYWFDVAIATFFGGPEFSRLNLLLNRLQFARKIDVIKDLTIARGVEDLFAGMVSELRALNTFRNNLAHSHINPYPSGRTEGEAETDVFGDMLENLSSFRSKVSGLEITRVDETVLQEYIERCSKVDYLQFWTAMMPSSPGEGSPRDAVVRYRELNDAERGGPSGMPDMDPPRGTE